MASVTRSTKDNGSTNWVQGDSLNADDLNGDINPIIAAFDEDIDTPNLKDGAVVDAKVGASAAIATKKLSTSSAANSSSDRTASSWTTGLRAQAVTSHSNSVAAYVNTTDPGVTGSFAYPDTLTEELERLRYMLKRLGIGTNAKSTTGTASANWFDGNVTGPNLIANSAFLDFVANGATAPQGWTAVGTSPVFNGQSTTIDVTEGAGKVLLFTAGHANNNMTQTLSKLRASTKYLVEARMKPTVGTTKLITTGALGSGSFQNLDIVSAGTGWQTLSGIIQTDTTPTDIVVTIDPVGASDAVQLSYVSCKELSFADRMSRNEGSGIVVRAESASATPGTVAAALDITVVPPCPNCKIVATAQVTAANSAGSSRGMRMRLLENINGAGATEQSYTIGYANDSHDIYVIRTEYANTALVPGSTYQYTITLDTTDLPAANLSATLAEVSNWMTVELITP